MCARSTAQVPASQKHGHKLTACTGEAGICLHAPSCAHLHVSHRRQLILRCHPLLLITPNNSRIQPPAACICSPLARCFPCLTAPLACPFSSSAADHPPCLPPSLPDRPPGPRLPHRLACSCSSPFTSACHRCCPPAPLTCFCAAPLSATH